MLYSSTMLSNVTCDTKETTSFGPFLSFYVILLTTFVKINHSTCRPSYLKKNYKMQNITSTNQQAYSNQIATAVLRAYWLAVSYIQQINWAWCLKDQVYPERPRPPQ